MIENYIGWLVPEVQGLKDARYPSLVGLFIINTQPAVPSALSRRRVPGPAAVRLGKRPGLTARAPGAAAGPDGSG